MCYWLGVLLDVRPKAEDFKGLYVEVGADEVFTEYSDGQQEIWRADGTATIIDKHGLEVITSW